MEFLTFDYLVIPRITIGESRYQLNRDAISALRLTALFLSSSPIKDWFIIVPVINFVMISIMVTIYDI